MREEIGTEACLVRKLIEPAKIGWIHGQIERQNITFFAERLKETRSFL